MPITIAYLLSVCTDLATAVETFACVFVRPARLTDTIRDSMRQLPVGLYLMAVVLCAGCSLFKTEADVESNTSWSGSFDGRTVDGSGNQTVKMDGGSGPHCAVVQKKTRTGSLKVSISHGESKTTTAEFGLVSVCSD